MYRNFEDNMILVIDDFIDKDYQEKIKKILLGEIPFKFKIENEDIELDFPWYFIEDVTAAGDDDSQHRCALSHQYVSFEGSSPGEVDTDFHELFIPLLQRAAMKIGIGEISVLQGRSFLQFPLNLKEHTVDTPHIDLENWRHFVVLYYVCDSDGDTIIYNEKQYGLEKYTEKHRVSPKQGRCVIFDGTQMHTAEQPINSNIRCVVNYNLN